MRVLRPWLFVCFAVAAVLAQSCSNDAGTNPFLVGDAAITPDAGGGDDMEPSVCEGCTVAGACFNGDEQTRCGAAGAECVACGAGQVCDEGGSCIDEPTCGPSNCDGCCDATGECVGGTDNTACGTGGLLCTNCGTGQACEEGTCRAPCGPDNCAGCCDANGACLTGDEDALCGASGGDCADCEANGDSCSQGQCVSAACADSCAGCCDGDTCIEPTTAAQCGATGAACVMCPAGSTCTLGTCDIDPTSTWSLFVASGEVGATDAEGESWDGFNGLPDPYVTVVIPNQTDASTDVIDDTLTPQWDIVLVTAVPASDLSSGLQFRYLDADAAFDDEICTIDVTVRPNDTAFNGGLREATCPDPALGKITWRLEPAP